MKENFHFPSQCPEFIHRFIEGLFLIKAPKLRAFNILDMKLDVRVEFIAGTIEYFRYETYKLCDFIFSILTLQWAFMEGESLTWALRSCFKISKQQRKKMVPFQIALKTCTPGTFLISILLRWLRHHEIFVVAGNGRRCWACVSCQFAQFFYFHFIFNFKNECLVLSSALNFTSFSYIKIHQ